VREEAASGPSEDGSVVLELGGDLGALVLRVPAELLGTEIDLVPDDQALLHTHSAVRERLVEPEHVYAAVYPSLRAGRYRIEGSEQVVEVVGGKVTDVAFDPSGATCKVRAEDRY
jgi:hypothetical protein